ncbi:MAG: gas vesicle protein GvpN [Xanthobacteraceae bacterium]|jgi:gas vesicle protein GvpN
MSTAPHSVSQLAGSTISLRPSTNFVETAAVQDLRNRALGYLSVGYPVHFRGPAGSGKTTLAFHVAAQLGRPVVFLTGDEEMTTSNLVGGQFGFQYRKVVDRFIHTVLKYEEDATRKWSDHRLTTACREGHTLIYDEFTRSRPEANNILLGVLEERLLVLPVPNQNESYVRVHPDFRAIFTSNPQEYSGVHDAQDALSDRMVMIDVDYLDRETELAITAARSGLAESKVEQIVDLVRDYRASGEYDQAPTLRGSIMIARVVADQDLQVSSADSRFVQTCLDLLGARSPFKSRSNDERVQQRKMLISLVQHHCPAEHRGDEVADKRLKRKSEPARARLGQMAVETR